MINAILKTIDMVSETKRTFIKKLVIEFERIGMEQEKHYIIESGVSKIAIILPKSNYVYKIPVSSIINKKEINTCEREIILYNKAKENELNDIFIETRRIIDGKIYFQKKVYPCQEDTEDSHYVNCYIDKLSDFSNPPEMDNNKWIKDFLEIYGEDKWWKFCKFINNNTNDISDNNIGYDSKGNPIVFDYAGIDFE